MLQKAEGLHYFDFLARLHAGFLFDWYLEIGSRKGDSFAHSRSKTIAVDPFFRLRGNVMGAKPTLLLFQGTSDDFFADDTPRRLGARLSFSFLDGMHLFEYLLRDFMNTEERSTPKGVIALHDCCPYTTQMTTRDLANLPKGDWTGDVWKLLVILREYRPDLTVTVLDAAPTGLVLVHGLDPENPVLRDNYDAILARFTQMELADFGTARFSTLFPQQSAAAFADAGFPPFAAIAEDASAAYTPHLHST